MWTKSMMRQLVQQHTWVQMDYHSRDHRTKSFNALTGRISDHVDNLATSRATTKGYVRASHHSCQFRSCDSITPLLPVQKLWQHHTTPASSEAVTASHHSCLFIRCDSFTSLIHLQKMASLIPLHKMWQRHITHTYSEDGFTTTS